MGLAWQQGPLATGAIGRFLVPDPLPGADCCIAEPLRRRMRVQFGEAGSPTARTSCCCTSLATTRWPTSRSAHIPGACWNPASTPPSTVTSARQPGTPSGPGRSSTPRSAWQHTELPDYAGDLKGRVAFAWRAMDAFYEEDERIVGHAADPYHRIDIRQTSRHLVVRHGDQVIADTSRPLALYESGFAPRWYVPRDDVNESVLTAVEGQTFCPYKGVCSYYDVDDAHRAAWSYLDAWPEVGHVAGFISFEPDKVEVSLDGTAAAARTRPERDPARHRPRPQP